MAYLIKTRMIIRNYVPNLSGPLRGPWALLLILSRIQISEGIIIKDGKMGNSEEVLSSSIAAVFFTGFISISMG